MYKRCSRIYCSCIWYLAQGQSTLIAVSNGSYAKGNMFLFKGEIAYVYVGCSGVNGGYTLVVMHTDTVMETKTS